MQQHKYFHRKVTVMRKLYFFLAALLMLNAVSCGSSDTTTETILTDGTDEPAVTEPTYDLPEADFGGEEVQFFLGEEFSKLQAAEENGDTVNDSIYLRNRKVEEMYNCKFVYNLNPCSSSTWNTWYASLESSIMAGDDSIDIAGGYAYRFAALSITSGLFLNILDIPEIDMSKPWWPGNISEAACVGSKLFMVQGNVDPMFYDCIFTLIFNKELANSLQLDMYGIVDDGKWTIDKLEEVAKLATADLDGNGALDDKDQWGFATGQYVPVDAFNFAFDLEFVSYDQDGIPSLLPLSEKLTDACTRMKDFLLNSNTAQHCDEEIKKQMFKDGRALIVTSDLGEIQSLRDLETNFGIIPYPKWDENQEQYLSFSAGVDSATGYCIPLTADGALGGTILEALACYGYHDIMPVYYEKVLKGKNTRDDESAVMLDLIFNNISFDFTQIYSFAFGDEKAPSMLMRTTINNNKDITSAFAADKQMYIKTIEKLVEALS